jgi:hypothetical protein
VTSVTSPVLTRFSHIVVAASEVGGKKVVQRFLFVRLITGGYGTLKARSRDAHHKRGVTRPARPAERGMECWSAVVSRVTHHREPPYGMLCLRCLNLYVVLRC